MRSALKIVLLLAALLQPLQVAVADDAKPDAAKTDSKTDAKKDKPDLPAFPADARLKQSITLGGKTLAYTATVGSLPVRDEDGKKIAEVMFIAYVLDGPRDPNRPVTFAFNGGPGASSAFLNIGALGPKRIAFGNKGDSPSDPALLRDNPGTWLDFTDLVFIDPVGTGYSRSLMSKDDTNKNFFSIKPDIQYLSRIVYDWLVKNERLTAPKYVVGESYGGYRAPAIAHELQTVEGVGVSGIVMVSPALDFRNSTDPETSPLSWMKTLPSMAASNYERQGKTLNPAQMAEVENYVRTDFALDLLRGRQDAAAVDRLVSRVTAYTGLPEADVRRVGGRVPVEEYLRGLYRDQGKIGSQYDSNVTAYDPFPWSAESKAEDPILSGIIAPITSAMVDFITRQAGWKLEAHYEVLNLDVNKRWEKGWFGTIESATDLRQSLAIDGKLKAIIVHGYDDLSCPYFGSEIVVSQIPTMGSADRLQVKVYPGGHMFYSRPDSQAAFRRDAMTLYGLH